MIISFEGTNLNVNASRSAIRELGTNCLPLLGHWLQRDTPAWKVKVGRFLWQRGIQTTLFPPQEEALLAGSAVWLLGEKALPLAAQLASSCTNSNEAIARMATMILSSQAISIQREALFHLDDSLRDSLQRSLKVLSAQAQAPSSTTNSVRVRLDTLKKVLRTLEMKPHSQVILSKLKGSSIETQARALRLLSRRQYGYAQVEQFLLEHLSSTNSSIAANAAVALKNYGAQAEEAIPALQAALSHPSVAVRTEATNAISPASDRAFFQVRKWPIPKVKVGAAVTVIGYPKCHVEFDADGKLTTGRSWLGFQVSSVSDRHFVLANEYADRSYMFRDDSTKSTAPLLLPGMSGSPAFWRTPNDLRLVGFLYEGNDSDGTIFCTHASFLSEEGLIDHHALPI